MFYNIRPYKVYKPRLSCAIFVLLKNSRCTPKSFKSNYFVFCFYQQLCQFIEVNSNNVFAILCFTFYCLPCKLSPLQIITSISLKKKHTHTHTQKKNDFNLRKKGSTNQYSVTAAQDPSNKQNNTRWEMLNACRYTGSVTNKLPVCNGLVLKESFLVIMTFWDRHLCITASLVHSQRWSFYRGLTEITFYCNGEVSMDELVSLASLFFVDHIYSGSQLLRGWYWKLGWPWGGGGGEGGNPNLHSKWFTWLPGFLVLVFQYLWTGKLMHIQANFDILNSKGMENPLRVFRSSR